MAHTQSAVLASGGAPVRAALSRERVVASGLALVRAEGLAALSMRRVAADLGATPMALYRYVADRRDLLQAMVNHVAAEIDVPPVAADARTEIVQVVTAVREAQLREPWVLQALYTEKVETAVVRPVVERLFAALARLGVTGLAAVAAEHLLWQFVAGEVLAVVDDAVGGEEEWLASLDAEACPAMAAAYVEWLRPPRHKGVLFARNLQSVLDGLLPS